MQLMKTIAEAKGSIAKLWGHPKPKETNYRLMKYLLQCETDDGLLLHNVVTGHLILLTAEEKALLSNLPGNTGEKIQGLVANHFLVPEGFDEYRSVNQLRRILQKRDAGDVINHYVILPTTFCNARCFYCYENGYPQVQMTEETASKLIEFIDEHRNGKDISINWFGGEPMVGIARIDQISQGLKEREISFSSSMVSNGYLFDQTIIDRSVELWNLKRVQITLDGTEDVYNRVKAYVNADDNPYRRVLKNIDLLTSRKIHVNIRLNTDFYNKDDIGVLIEELANRYSGNKFVSVYLNVLFSNAGREPVNHSTDDLIVLTRIIDEYSRRLKDLGFGSSKHHILPSLKLSQCMADNPHTMMIQPDGSFCRCEHENIEANYGNLDEGILDQQRLIEWNKTIERSENCPECCLYPYCYLLRLCKNAESSCIDEFRMNTQRELEEQIRAVYIKSLKEEKNEEV